VVLRSNTLRLLVLSLAAVLAWPWAAPFPAREPSDPPATSPTPRPRKFARFTSAPSQAFFVTADKDEDENENDADPIGPMPALTESVGRGAPGCAASAGPRPARRGVAVTGVRSCRLRC
jgi:hypothetical protein